MDRHTDRLLSYLKQTMQAIQATATFTNETNKLVTVIAQELVDVEFNYVLWYYKKFWILATSQVIPKIQDSGADSRPQTVEQSRTGKNRRCCRVLCIPDVCL